MITKRDLYINHVCEKIINKIIDFQESLYETNLQAPVTNANEIISVMHTLLNQLDEQ